MRYALIALLLSAVCQAASTTSWELNTYADFSKGRFNGLSLTREGKVQLAPKVETLLASDQPAIWSIAKGPDGTLYLGTGHKGRVLAVDRQGKSTVLFTAPEAEVFAIAWGPDNAVYAATSPDGKVYRIAGGKSSVYFAPKERYLWSLAFGKDGALYVGAGDTGKVYKVTAEGQGQLYYETGQTHVTALSVDNSGHVLAGTEPNGILYRISAKDKAFVLYDSNLPELRSMVQAPDGTLYVAALGGSVAQRTNAASSATSPAAPVTAPTTSITVTDTAPTQAGIDVKAKADTPQTPPAAVNVPVSPAMELTGVEKSALYRIRPDNRVDTIWTSKEENAYDILLEGSDIYLATDTQGRIYRLNSDRQSSLIAQTNEAEMTRLFDTGSGLVAATGSTGKLLAFSKANNPTGEFESPVHDSGSVARWGTLDWKAELPQNTAMAFRTRSGNSSRPDRTWSEWSEPMSKPSQIKSPNARFVQWKAELRGTAGQTPTLDHVWLSYLPQNNPPSIRSFNVTTFTTGTTAPKTTPPASTSSNANYSVTVTDTGDVSAASSAGTPTQTFGRSVTQQVFLNWQADDPDNDRLLYSLFYRAEDESSWKLLRSNFADLSFSIDSDIFADGRYYFKLLASDKAVNSPETALENENISAPVLFDNTPPLVSSPGSRRTGATAEIRFEAKDASSALRRAEYSIDAGSWTPADPVDGIMDQQSESWVLKLTNLSAGEHVVVFRVYDGAGNTGLQKVVLR